MTKLFIGRYFMNKLYLLLISFFLIFNLSCDDDDYPTTFEDDSTYNLTWNYSITGGTGGAIDYADNNAIENKYRKFRILSLF